MSARYPSLSLQAQRSNPEATRAALDWFAALAKTHGRGAYQHSWRPA